MNPDQTQQPQQPFNGGQPLTPQQVQDARAKLGFGNPTTPQGSTQVTQTPQQRMANLGFNLDGTPTNTQPDQSNQGGFFSNLASDFKNRQSQMSDVLERGIGGKNVVNANAPHPKVANVINTGLQALGTGAGLGSDIFSEGIKSLLGTVGDMNPTLKTAVVEGAKTLAQSPLGQAAIQAASQGIDKYNTWAKANPVTAKNVESVFNIASFIPVGLAGVKAVEAAPGVVSDVASNVKNVVSGAKEAITGTPEDIASSKTWDMIKPNLTPTEQSAAVKSGAITQDGIMGTITHNPIASDKAMIDAATPYVSNAKNSIEAVSNMQQGIIDKATALRSGLDDTGAIFSKSQIQGVLAKIEEPTMISSDATLNRAYNLVKNKLIDLTPDGGKLGDLLDVRKNFDQFISKQFPNLYNSDTLTPMRQAIRDIRGAINDTIDSRLPDGTLPDGTSFRQSLKDQSLLYQAIDNTASKVPKVGSNILTRTEAAIRNHPIVAGAAAYEGIKHATNPISGL